MNPLIFLIIGGLVILLLFVVMIAGLSSIETSFRTSKQDKRANLNASRGGTYTMAGVICPNCNYTNLPGVPFCQRCSASLIEGSAQIKAGVSGQDEVTDLFTEAQFAWKLGDERSAGILIDRILRKDFLHKGAWEYLHLRYGAGKPFEVFQREFSEKYYPGKIQLLLSTPEQETPQLPRTNNIEQYPVPTELIGFSWIALFIGFGLPFAGQTIFIIGGYGVQIATLVCAIALIRNQNSTAKTNGGIILGIWIVMQVLGFFSGVALGLQGGF
jgi:hypothetical protein